ncbi:MAG: magnesium/cobalt transporter CorA [Deltaproteobacteria bacterium]|nr:magnesium/cobalt transporter CorA [Deltaproteobacteria bacterium]
MIRLIKKRSKKAGLPPGTLVYTGDKAPVTPKITVMDYDEKNLYEAELPSFDGCLAYKNKPTTTWINVNGISHIPNVEKLGECFNLHPLVLEDILNIDQRPKIEDYDDYLFIVLKAIRYDGTQNEILTDQISLILGSNYVISLHENNVEIFDSIMERIRTAKGRIRKAGADYLAYALIDYIVDHYFIVLEKFGENIEFLEDEVVKQPSPQTLSFIHKAKNDMILLRKSMWPLREVVSRLERRESPLINDATSFYFKDVYDHVIVAIDTVETNRDILSGMLDIYLSSVSNKLNEIMKVLTIIATIFMPLTFLAGVYGMNFKHMPELEWAYGYYGTWGVMILVSGVMLIYFRRRKWI